MNKADLISKIASLHFNIYQKDSVKRVNVFFDKISKAISKNERVELRGFGIFDVKELQPRIAINPSNGSSVSVPAKKVAFFRMVKGII